MYRTYKKDKDIREGKGRRYRIDSIHVASSYFAPGWCEFILFFILVQFILFFISSWSNSSYSSNCPRAKYKHGKEINYLCLQTAATTFTFSSVFIILLWCTVQYWRILLNSDRIASMTGPAKSEQIRIRVFKRIITLTNLFWPITW